MKLWKQFFLCVLILVLFSALVSCNDDQGDGSAALVEANIYTFSDGKAVSTWSLQTPNDNMLLYLLEDGTELLSVRISPGLGYLSSDGIGPVPSDVLSQEAQDSIASFYAQQSTFYDIGDYLDCAYTEYISTEDKSEFRTHILIQNTYITAIDQWYVYCTTNILAPIGNGLYSSDSFCHTFDRQCGVPADGQP